MKSIARVLAAAIFGTALAATPLLAQTVTIDYDHSVNFLKFKTYTWEKIHATDPSVEDRINIALKRDMEGRYMTEVASGGDVTITAVEATQDKAEFSNFYRLSHRLRLAARSGRHRLSGFRHHRAGRPSGHRSSSTLRPARPTNSARGAVTEPVATSQDKNDRTIDHAVTRADRQISAQVQKAIVAAGQR